MARKIVRLRFRGPVHLGKGRLTDSASTFDAATLFSALFIEACHMGCSDELLDAARTGALGLSDAFPFIGDELYLPKPMVAPGLFEERNRERQARGERLDSQERKAAKKLPYVPAARYGDFLSGDLDVLAESERLKGLGTSFLTTKVNLTRSSRDDALPYFVGGYSFSQGAGLYFIVSGRYHLRPLLQQLSFSGIGGKRSSGYGRFEFEIEKRDPLATLTGATGQKVLVSTALPSEGELTDDLLAGARYQLVRKGGFVQSQTHAATPKKKRDMYLFASGSTFEHKFDGDIFDVNATPGAHPVWRYAKAMWAEV